MTLISVAGYKSSGKGEISKYLCSKYSFKPLKFAGKLKEIASTLYEVPIDYWEYDKETRKVRLQGLTKRQVLQNMGKTLRDCLSPDIWIYSLDISIYDIYKQSYVIDDLRYPNEFNWIRKNNGYVWYVDRGLVATDTHESESYLAYMKLHSDEILDNTSTISDLHAQIDVLMSSISDR